MIGSASVYAFGLSCCFCGLRMFCAWTLLRLDSNSCGDLCWLLLICSSSLILSRSFEIREGDSSSMQKLTSYIFNLGSSTDFERLSFLIYDTFCFRLLRLSCPKFKIILWGYTTDRERVRRKGKRSRAYSRGCSFEFDFDCS